MARIDRATLADARELAALHNAVAMEVTSRLGWGHWSKPIKVDSMRQRLLNSDGEPRSRTIYAYKDEGKILGSVTLSQRGMNLWRKRLWAFPEEAAISVFSLAVLPTHYGQGIGRALMYLAEDEAIYERLRWVRLDAYTENPDSNAFYRRLGYRNMGTQDLGSVSIDLYEKEMPPQ